MGHSTLWRYTAGANTVAAWYRNCVKIGTDEVIRLLQTVTAGMTEHSVVCLPNRKEVWVANARLDGGMWDAPYQDWARFQFAELFGGGAGAKL
jgi:hypothetical protein